MRHRAQLALLACMVAWVAGCGKITFGGDLVPPGDGGSLEDAGAPDVPDLPDVGPPDSGAEPLDGDCLPVQLPSEWPEAWPFPVTQGGYRELFGTWALEQRCEICHASRFPPLIPEERDLGSRYGEAIQQLWDLVRESRPLVTGQPPTGGLWRHHAMHPEHEPPAYTTEQSAFLGALIREGWSCGVEPAFARQDAGPMCGAPDAGAPGDDDAGGDAGGGDAGDGGPDAGVVDAGGGTMSTGLCYCPDLPDAGALETRRCVR